MLKLKNTKDNKMQKTREALDTQQEALVETCVMCKQFTPYIYSTPIHLRKWYIEGGGQLCETCYNKLYKNVK